MNNNWQQQRTTDPEVPLSSFSADIYIFSPKDECKGIVQVSSILKPQKMSTSINKDGFVKVDMNASRRPTLNMHNPFYCFNPYCGWCPFLMGQNKHVQFPLTIGHMHKTHQYIKNKSFTIITPHIWQISETRRVTFLFSNISSRGLNPSRFVWLCNCSKNT